MILYHNTCDLFTRYLEELEKKIPRAEMLELQVFLFLFHYCFYDKHRHFWQFLKYTIVFIIIHCTRTLNCGMAQNFAVTVIYM